MSLKLRRLSQLSKLLLGLIVISCGQTYNSNTGDIYKVPLSSCADPTDTLFCEANAVIQDKCVNCHSGFHDTWASFDTSEKWVASGESRVVSGAPLSSTMITKLQQDGGNMPEDDAPISTEERQKIFDWILAL